MQEKKTLLDRARVDLVNVESNMKNTEDELFIDIAAYHLHQAVEKMLKFQMTMIGEEFKRTHDIKVLWGNLEDFGVTPPEWIWENASILNRYQNETKYGEDLVASRREVRELHALAVGYYEEVKAQVATVQNNDFTPKRLWADGV